LQQHAESCGFWRQELHTQNREENAMAKQDKGSVCACGCGERKTSRKKLYVQGHNQTRRDTRKKEPE